MLYSSLTRVVLSGLLAAGVAVLGDEELAKVDLKKVPPAVDQQIDFRKDIKPILEASCVKCHGGRRPKHGYSMETREKLLTPGRSELKPLIVGKSLESLIIHVSADAVESDDYKMPPLDDRDRFPKLKPGQVGMLRAWIDQGAKWPEGLVLQPPPQEE